MEMSWEIGLGIAGLAATIVFGIAGLIRWRNKSSKQVVKGSSGRVHQHIGQGAVGEQTVEDNQGDVIQTQTGGSDVR
jgi:hypothetical protein